MPETIILSGGGLMVLVNCGIDLQLLPLQIESVCCCHEDMLTNCLSLLGNERRSFLHIGIRLDSLGPVDILMRVSVWLEVCVTLADQRPFFRRF